MRGITTPTSKCVTFETAKEKTKALPITGEEVTYHFPDIRKTIAMPKGAENITYKICLLRKNQKRKRNIYCLLNGICVI